MSSGLGRKHGKLHGKVVRVRVQHMCAVFQRPLRLQHGIRKTPRAGSVPRGERSEAGPAALRSTRRDGRSGPQSRGDCEMAECLRVMYLRRTIPGPIAEGAWSRLRPRGASLRRSESNHPLPIPHARASVSCARAVRAPPRHPNRSVLASTSIRTQPILVMER